MNKIYILGWIYNIKNEEIGDNGKYIVTFSIKTKKLVGNKSKKTEEYDYIKCDIRGKKAMSVVKNCIEGQKASIWGRININNQAFSVAVDDIVFL